MLEELLIALVDRLPGTGVPRFYSIRFPRVVFGHEDAENYHGFFLDFHETISYREMDYNDALVLGAGGIHIVPHNLLESMRERFGREILSETTGYRDNYTWLVSPFNLLNMKEKAEIIGEKAPGDIAGPVFSQEDCTVATLTHPIDDEEFKYHLEFITRDTDYLLMLKFFENVDLPEGVVSFFADRYGECLSFRENREYVRKVAHEDLLKPSDFAN